MASLDRHVVGLQLPPRKISRCRVSRSLSYHACQTATRSFARFEKVDWSTRLDSRGEGRLSGRGGEDADERHEEEEREAEGNVAPQDAHHTCRSFFERGCDLEFHPRGERARGDFLSPCLDLD